MATAWWMVGRQAEASTALHRHLAAPEEARTAGRHVGRGDQQLGTGAGAQQREIDVRLEQFAKGIEIQRIEVVGREQARHLGHARATADAREPGIVAQEIGHAGLCHRLPHRPELGAGGGAAAFGEPRRNRHGVYCAGAGAADPADVERVVLQQAIEHAPGEGAMRPAALERQVEASLSARNSTTEALIRPPRRAPRRDQGPSWQHAGQQHNRHAFDRGIARIDAIDGGKVLAFQDILGRAGRNRRPACISTSCDRSARQATNRAAPPRRCGPPRRGQSNTRN